jgi:hypothetical protein
MYRLIETNLKSRPQQHKHANRIIAFGPSSHAATKSGMDRMMGVKVDR